MGLTTGSDLGVGILVDPLALTGRVLRGVPPVTPSGPGAPDSAQGHTLPAVALIGG